MKKTSKMSGFTLIEVLVAMLILAIGLLGLAGITVVVLRSNTLSQQVSEATTVAADLMETLKRQDIGTLPDCVSTSVYSSIPTSCTALVQSGVTTLGTTYYPSLTNVTCSLTGILGSGVTETFDMISANLVTKTTSPDTTDICTATANTTMPARNYFRYYKTYAPSVGSSDRILVVVILWKDKFGKWRNIHFSTTRTTGN